MPKEITHWLIVDAVLDRIQREHKATQENTASLLPSHNIPDVPFSTIERSNQWSHQWSKELAYLGATYHDVLYYVPQKRGLPPFTHVADLLHGSRGEDTFELVRLLANDCAKYPDKPFLRSFLLGVCTHICADVTFHPLIYWASGNWHGKGLFAAQRQHRALESWIDVHFCGADWNKLHSFSMRNMLHRHAPELQQIYGLAARHSYWKQWMTLGRRECADAISRGFANLAFARIFCENTFANAIMQPLERLLSTRLQSFVALRYARDYASRDAALLARAPFQHVQGRIAYTHPVSGKAHEISLEELFERSVDESLQLWRRVEKDLNAGKMPLANVRGASLEVGIPEIPASAMKHFAGNI